MEYSSVKKAIAPVKRECLFSELAVGDRFISNSQEYKKTAKDTAKRRIENNADINQLWPWNFIVKRA